MEGTLMDTRDMKRCTERGSQSQLTAIYILTVLSTMRRPRDDTGGVVSQAPASFLSEASKRALDASSAGRQERGHG